MSSTRQLSKEDIELFYKLYHPLLVYANMNMQYLRILFEDISKRT